MRVPEKHQVVGDVERIDDRKRQHPRSQSPDAVGVDQQYDAEQRTQHEVVRDAVELVTEDYQPAYRWIVGELERLGEIRNCEDDKQDRHHGEEPSTRRASGIRRFICHVRQPFRNFRIKLTSASCCSYITMWPAFLIISSLLFLMRLVNSFA